MKLISVIMPIYSGERFLQQTLDSLSAQSFKNFEVLCVDDCSPDGSSDIVRRHVTYDSRFRYLKTPENLGIVPKVMNFSAQFARGDCFVYSSQDDLFSQDWLQKMFSRMQETGADAVIPDVEFYHEGATLSRRLVGYCGDRTAVISGRQAFLASLDWRISGNALWRIKFLKEHGFHDFGMFADEYSVRNFFLNCQTVAFCDAVFYYRQDNPHAITKSPSSKLLDAPDNQFRIWKLIKDNGFGQEIQGPYAIETVRTLVRTQALIFDTPSLRDQRHRIDSQFDIMQAPDFVSSVRSANRYRGGSLVKMSYVLAHRSRLWLDTLSQASRFVKKCKRLWRAIARRL